MKMRIVVYPASTDIQEAWNRYSQTRNPADKPAGSGPSPRVVVTNRRVKGAKRWAVRSSSR